MHGPSREGHPPWAAPQCRPPPSAPPCGEGLCARAPSPRGNLKHGAPNRGSAQTAREGTRARAPLGQGSEGGPQAEGRGSAPRAGPDDAAARRAKRPRPPLPAPRAGRSAPARPGGDPGAGQRAAGLGGGDLGCAGLWTFWRPRRSGATRQSQAAPRASPRASSSAPRKPETSPHVPQCWRQKSYLRSAGRPGAPRRGDEAGARVLLGGAQRLGAGRKPQPRAATAAPPAPLCRRHRGSAELRRGPTPRHRAEKANLVPTPLPRAGEGTTAALRTVTLEQPPPSWRRVRLWGQRL